MVQTVTDVPKLCESKGGVKFEVLLCNEKTQKAISTSTKKTLSLIEIEKKLEAAEGRRRSQEAQRVRQNSRRLSHVLEVQTKKRSFIQKFKIMVRENYDRKLRKCSKNREAYLKQIKAKNQNFLKKVKHIKNITPFGRESKVNALCKQFEMAQDTKQTELTNQNDC